MRALGSVEGSPRLRQAREQRATCGPDAVHDRIVELVAVGVADDFDCLVRETECDNGERNDQGRHARHAQGPGKGQRAERHKVRQPVGSEGSGGFARPKGEAGQEKDERERDSAREKDAFQNLGQTLAFF